jgi:hypothetical protein
MDTHEQAANASTDIVAKARLELIGDKGVGVAWAASTAARPYANLGDALSPIIISTLSGLPVTRRNFDSQSPRLCAVGTIGHAQKNGSVHLWGTGMDGAINPVLPSTPYSKPDGTQFTIHATRGPFTGDIFRREGLVAPEIYGDPVWFLPKLFPRPAAPPTYELGVILHLTELDAYTSTAGASDALERYSVPEELKHAVRIISPITDRDLKSMEERLFEILSCKRIASTSLHGLVIAETYGIPCVWFAPFPGGGQIAYLDREDCKLDHRMRDFYAGVGKWSLPIFASDRRLPTDWNELIRWIDKYYTPCDFDGAALFDAYPLPKAVSFGDNSWPLDRELTSTIQF